MSHSFPPSWAASPARWSPPPPPPRPKGPGALVVTLAVVIAALLLTAGVAAAVKATSGTSAARSASSSPSPGLPGSSGRKASGHSATTLPGTAGPADATNPSASTTSPTTRAGGVAPVSPLSVPPVTTAPVAARPLTVAPAVIAARVNPAIVDIDTRLAYEHAVAAGTGMVLTSTGIVLTNNHVIAGATTLGAVSIGTGKSYGAHVLGVDPTADVALLQLEGASGLPTVTTSTDRVTPGDGVVAIGNAGGVGGTPSVTEGTVVAVDQSIVASDPAAGTSEQLDGLIETSATLSPGDSGGPLANASSQVIGMDTAASVANGSTTTESFAIPIGQALAIARQIEAGQASSTVFLGLPPFLGVQVTDGSRGGRPGAAVTGLVAGSPAAGVGVTVGSLITAVNGQPIDLPSTLTRVLRTFRPGDTVNLSWLDAAGRPHTSRLTLGTGPAD